MKRRNWFLTLLGIGAAPKVAEAVATDDFELHLALQREYNEKFLPAWKESAARMDELRRILWKTRKPALDALRKHLAGLGWTQRCPGDEDPWRMRSLIISDSWFLPHAKGELAADLCYDGNVVFYDHDEWIENFCSSENSAEQAINKATILTHFAERAGPSYWIEHCLERKKPK